jgi:tetratricopeptide (TPR) repeat protein
VNFPDAWFLNALGHYYQQNLENAEKSARQGIRMDEEHHTPKLELLLGVVLAQRRKYDEAADHLRQYLRLVPSGADSDSARKQLDAVTQLASTAPSTVTDKK